MFFFSFVNVLQPRQVHLPTIVKSARELFKGTPTFTFCEKFIEFDFDHKKKHFHIHKIFGKSLLDDTTYDIKRFQLRSTTLVDEFTIWFSMRHI